MHDPQQETLHTVTLDGELTVEVECCGCCPWTRVEYAELLGVDLTLHPEWQKISGAILALLEREAT